LPTIDRHNNKNNNNYHQQQHILIPKEFPLLADRTLIVCNSITMSALPRRPAGGSVGACIRPP
jgi:hypothetical protein